MVGQVAEVAEEGAVAVAAAAEEEVGAVGAEAGVEEGDEEVAEVVGVDVASTTMIPTGK